MFEVCAEYKQALSESLRSYPIKQGVGVSQSWSHQEREHTPVRIIQGGFNKVTIKKGVGRQDIR